MSCVLAGLNNAERIFRVEPHCLQLGRASLSCVPKVRPLAFGSARKAVGGGVRGKAGVSRYRGQCPSWVCGSTEC